MEHILLQFSNGNIARKIKIIYVCAKARVGSFFSFFIHIAQSKTNWKYDRGDYGMGWDKLPCSKDYSLAHHYHK